MDDQLPKPKDGIIPVPMGKNTVITVPSVRSAGYLRKVAKVNIVRESVQQMQLKRRNDGQRRKELADCCGADIAEAYNHVTDQPSMKCLAVRSAAEAASLTEGCAVHVAGRTHSSIGLGANW